MEEEGDDEEEEGEFEEEEGEVEEEGEEETGEEDDEEEEEDEEEDEDEALVGSPPSGRAAAATTSASAAGMSDTGAKSPASAGTTKRSARISAAPPTVHTSPSKKHQETVALLSQLLRAIDPLAAYARLPPDLLRRQREVQAAPAAPAPAPAVARGPFAAKRAANDIAKRTAADTWASVSPLGARPTSPDVSTIFEVRDLPADLPASPRRSPHELPWLHGLR